jgi:hypothetical protein
MNIPPLKHTTDIMIGAIVGFIGAIICTGGIVVIMLLVKHFEVVNHTIK